MEFNLNVGDSDTFFFETNTGMDGETVSLNKIPGYTQGYDCNVLAIKTDELGRKVLHLECDEIAQDNTYVLIDG